MCCSFFFKVGNILKIPLDKLNFACSQMRIDQMTEDDYEFLREYHEILTPVTSALKTLSANKFSFGLYLPVLVGLNRKLNDAKKKNFVYGKPLAVAIEKGFQKRFFEFMDLFDVNGRSTPLYIAMTVNPQYKLNFLGFERIVAHTSTRIFDMLLNAAKEIVDEERERIQNRSNSVSVGDTNTIANGTNSRGGM